jgi:hypothetical protein
VPCELALCAFACQANAAFSSAPGKNGATGLGTSAGKKSKLANAPFLRGLKRSFHTK